MACGLGMGGGLVLLTLLFLRLRVVRCGPGPADGAREREREREVVVGEGVCLKWEEGKEEGGGLDGKVAVELRGGRVGAPYCG
jgi:hypothetical protein